MFSKVQGLRPDVAAQWAALVEECRTLLANDGMESVQTHLAEQGVSIIAAIAITKALLGWDETPLRVAHEIVIMSGARNS